MTRAVRTTCLLVILVAFASACESDYPIWIPHDPDADALYRFRKGDRVGYIDQTGKVVIPATIRYSGGNSGDEFHNGRLEISASDGVYLDTAGKRVPLKSFYRGWDFSDGLAAAMAREGSLWGYINTDGDYAISPRFASGPDDYVWPFSDGLAQIEANGRFGYIDHSGNFVISPTLLDADSFHDGFARVVLEGPCAYFSKGPCPSFHTPGLSSRMARESQEELPICKFTFVDKIGHAISGKRYDYALHFSEGLAPVLVNGKWGYIDQTGDLVITTRFDHAEPFSDGTALVTENHLYGFIDSHGVYVIEPRFKWAESFIDGRAVVGDDGFAGPVWYIDHHGDQVFHRKFGQGSSFFKGLAHVKPLPKEETDDSKARFEYIDRDGRTVFAYTP